MNCKRRVPHNLFLVVSNEPISDVAGSCNGTYGGLPNNTIISPNHPQDYDNNQYCDWTITAPTGKNVVLKFTEFDTEYGYDILKIYNGEDSGGPLLHSISGGYSKEIISIGNKMYLSFTSDGSTTRSGFRGALTYTRGMLKHLC